MKIEDIEKYYAKISKEVGKVIVGKKEVIEKLFMAILCNGHVLLEDYPGLAKTLKLKLYPLYLAVNLIESNLHLIFCLLT